tara:strand:+ start:164 stop:322 length:159 start_codon:yes stop_codon:yes gene_type:complete
MTIVCDCCGDIAYPKDAQDDNKDPVHVCERCVENDCITKHDGHCEGAVDDEL